MNESNIPRHLDCRLDNEFSNMTAMQNGSNFKFCHDAQLVFTSIKAARYRTALILRDMGSLK